MSIVTYSPKNYSSVLPDEILSQNTAINFEVEKRPIFDAEQRKLPVLGVFRNDNNGYLGIVSDRYHIIQNRELAELASAISSKTLPLKIKSARVINGGSKVFIDIAFPHLSINVNKIGDIIETGVLLSTTHDGKGSMSVRVYSSRLVCLNGLRVSKDQFISSVAHKSSATAKIDAVRDRIHEAESIVRSFDILCSQLSKIKVDEDFVKTILERVFYVSEESNLEVSAQKQNQAREVLINYMSNDNNAFPEQAETAYALLQSFTRYIDHNRTIRVSGNETLQEAKDRSLHYGAGDAFKTKAAFEIVKLIKEDNLAELEDNKNFAFQ